MAVAYQMLFKGASLDQYDQVLVKMGLTPGGNGPPGALFHWAAATDDGLLVVDVWETAEQYDRFAAEQIGPFSREAGFSGPPEVTAHQVHSYLTGPSA